MASDTRPIGTRFKRPLTDDELAKVEHALRTGGPGQHGPAKAMVALWDIILGEAEGCTYAVATATDRGYHPNDYAIPRRQANELVKLMQGTRRAQVRHGVTLAWRNTGPASYDEDETPAGES